MTKVIKVDVAWCRERLMRLRKAVDGIDDGRGSFGGTEREWDEFHRSQPVAVAILKTLDPGDGSLSWEAANTPWQWRAVLEKAMGYLDDRRELAQALAPDAPSLSASEFHRWVWEPARPLWEIGQFRQALLTAWTSINAHLQAKVGRRDISDDRLLQECLNERDPVPGKLKLRVPGDPADQTVQSLQRGTLQMALGCVWAIRNPSAHLAAHDAGELDEQIAFEQMAALSALARLLDSCTVMTTADGTAGGRATHSTPAERPAGE
ncbi:TIGR02391 family protein [Kibdelosporangium aridum]|uniref:TIGR02391 family protein n=1 Tax=Kibdelosporangium aridum TaxID=2030 RepID=UPI001358E811|nr:TIGR02391 family protein [Kibdelosporangium aridum]